MSNINVNDVNRLARIILTVDEDGTLGGFALARAILNNLPAPQVIRTPADLEALDPDTALLDDGTVVFAKEVVGNGYWKVVYPAVVVASGEHVRACREALEGETT